MSVGEGTFPSPRKRKQQTRKPFQERRRRPLPVRSCGLRNPSHISQQFAAAAGEKKANPRDHGVQECECLNRCQVEANPGKKKERLHKHRFWTSPRAGAASRADALEEPQLKKFLILANTSDQNVVSKGWSDFGGGGDALGYLQIPAAGTINGYLM